MNNKGFTTVELILTIVLVAIIMATITNVTLSYKDKNNSEEIKTEIINYKNNLTKIIYDDILDTTDPIISLEKENDLKYNLISKNEKIIELEIIKDNDYIKGINYNNVYYEVPSASLELTEFQNIICKIDETNKLYSLEISFIHLSLDEIYNIRFIIES